MIYQSTLGGPTGPKTTPLEPPPMIPVAFFSLKLALQDRFGAYFWSSQFDLDFFTNILLHFVGFCDCFGLDFGGVRPPKSLIFIEKVVIFEVFEVLRSNALFVAFWKPLGLNFGAFPSLLGRLWGHFSGPKATTPKSPPHFLRVPASKCAPDLPKVPKRSPRTPQKCQNGPPNAF